MSASLQRRIQQRLSDQLPGFVELCSRLVQIPSENPPGSTDDLARFISGYLAERNIEHQTFEPRPGNPLIVSMIGSHAGRHLILNAHLDTFPVGDPEPWSRAPFSGDVDQGRIHGRGVADMKAGLTISIATYLLLHEFTSELDGRVSLTLVSDEETGGAWGAKWLLEQHPEYIGDALLNAEPTGPGTIWVGEKGLAWFRLVARGKGGHGSGGRGDNAITQLAQAILAVRDIVQLRGSVPEGYEDAFAEQSRQEMFDGEEPMGELLTSPSLNAGTVTGGVKANVVPDRAQAEIDVRIPFGIQPEDIFAEAERLLHAAGVKGVSVEPISGQGFPANIISSTNQLLSLVRNRAAEVTGLKPSLGLCPGATDGRFWRSRGVSTVIFGPTSHGMAAPDEYVEIGEVEDVLTVHALAAADYLSLSTPELDNRPERSEEGGDRTL